MATVPVTRKLVRKWRSLRLNELEHQHENAYLFAEDDEDLEEMRSAIFAEWCAVQTAPKMELPPLSFVREFG